MIQAKPAPKLEEILFRVEEQPLFVCSTKDLEGNPVHVPVDGFRAIVDVERGRVLAVVSKQYRLVENEEAIALGRLCFAQVFNRNAEGMQLFNIVQPSTRSFCHVDFLEELPATAAAPEWRPFLRVTNSYNRMHPLRFDVGLCRGICTNGMIFGKRSIEFRYPHTTREIARTVQFRTSFKSIGALQAECEGWMTALKSIPVERTYVPALVCGALGLSLEEDRWKSASAGHKLAEFAEHLGRLDEGYAKELGRNGYAAFNVITDLASRPVAAISSPSAIHRLQRRASEWIEGVATQSGKGEFRMPGALAPAWERSKAIAAFAEFHK